ncbi:hypothetical protein J4474_02090 [Candidatus Pacearchaeota archaeon]|nr:hypothetical protein [Candidatus Pacearchaeota archaeon]
MGKILKKIRKAIATAGIVLLPFEFLYLASELPQRFNDWCHMSHPSKERVEFENQVGFPILGWDGDVEKNLSNLSIIYDVVKEEKATRNFNINSIEIESDNYLKKSLFEKFANVIGTEYSGLYNPSSNRIILKSGGGRHTITHEIKHAKTFEIMEKNPEFLEEWKKLAIDKNGKSFYLTEREQIFSKTKGLSRLVDENKKDLTENQKLGFVSNYARTNVLEDIAELTGAAQENPNEFMDWLFGDGKDQNEIIKKKVELAKKQALIPPEFSEMVYLENEIKKITWPEGYVSGDPTKFMKESEEFLKKYQESIYSGSVLRARARILEEKAMGKLDKEGREEFFQIALDEYKKVLKTKFKGCIYYPMSLGQIREIYQIELSDPKKSEIFQEAYEEYHKRLNNGNPNLTTFGVNDFLEARGINLK